MPFIETEDEIDLYVKDWGEGRPVILIHGWPELGLVYTAPSSVP